jgi:hypothetical protein
LASLVENANGTQAVTIIAFKEFVVSEILLKAWSLDEDCHLCVGRISNPLANGKYRPLA